MYYVITTSEDGDVSFQALDKETLLQRLNEGYWGNCLIKQIKPGECHDVRERTGIYIITGELVLPKPKTRVVEWEI